MHRRFIVAGPPGSGKSTLVQARAAAGSLIWDYDLVVQVLTGLPLHCHPAELVPHLACMRDALIDSVSRRPPDRDVWILTTSRPFAGRLARRWRTAELVQLDTPQAECLRRLALRGPIAEPIRAAVADWFEVGSP
jgi:hypothetical protein